MGLVTQGDEEGALTLSGFIPPNDRGPQQRPVNILQVLWLVRFQVLTAVAMTVLSSRMCPGVIVCRLFPAFRMNVLLVCFPDLLFHP
jgi:hypothetical protein